jgi:hypothetical protein
MSHPRSARPIASLHWLGLAPALVIFIIGLCSDSTLPGVYMDGVNPDYMVVPIVNPEAKSFPIWILDGNYWLGRFPIMFLPYSGALPVWFGCRSTCYSARA